MSPDDIPTEITKLVYGAPRIGGFGPSAVQLSQNELAQQLAHVWPAIEAHIAAQLADRLEERNPDRGAEFSEGVDWCVDELRTMGAGQ